MPLATGDCMPAEASPKDRVWGIGMYAAAAATDPSIRPGRNLLGRVLMAVREELRKEEG